MAIRKRASCLRVLGGCVLAMAMNHPSTAAEPDAREGLECETGRVIAYRVHRGWGYIDDIIIGREAELASGCIRMPQGLSTATKDNLASPDVRWPGGIVPYFVNSQITPSTRATIEMAIKHFADHTPIRFVPYTDQADFVGFEVLDSPASASGVRTCGMSVIGKKGGGQPIWLNQAVCQDELFGTALHEMMHALGFRHEHQRPDRDAYVAVTTGNSNCSGANFQIFPQTSFGPYDYASIMHYDEVCLRPLRAVSIPLTLYKGDLARCKLVTSVGQRCSLSDGDFFALWHFYPPASTPLPALSPVQLSAALGVVLRAAKASRGAAAPPVSASIPGALSGLWWGGPSENGWGIVFTQRGPNIFAAWFTYDDVGNPTWYVASSCAGVGTSAVSGTCSGALYRVNGHAFFGVAFTPVTSGNIVAVGNLQVTFQSATAAVMSYSLAGRSRTVSIARQPLASGTTLPAINYTDLWWSGPQESGWGISITQQYSTIFIAWYVYDAAGRPTWYVVPNCPVVGSGCSGTLYRTIGPPGPGFNAAGNQVIPVGSIDVAFDDPNNGTIRYTVDGTSGTKAITRQLF